MIFSHFGLTSSMVVRGGLAPTIQRTITPDQMVMVTVNPSPPVPVVPIPPPVVTPPSVGWGTIAPPEAPPAANIAPPPAIDQPMLEPLPPTPMVIIPVAPVPRPAPTSDSSKAVLWFGAALAALLIARKMK